MVLVAASLFLGALNSEPLFLEHCVEESEQSEPFCFLEKLTESTVSVIATKETEKRVLGLQLILPTSGREFDAIKDITLDFAVVSDLDYFEQAKDVYGGFFYQPWKLEEFSNDRHDFSKDPKTALDMLGNFAVQPYGFDGPKPNYQSRYPKLGNPYLMDCESRCETGILSGAIAGFMTGASFGINSANGLMNGAPMSPAVVAVRVSMATVFGGVGMIGGMMGVSASPVCNCDADPPNVASANQPSGGVSNQDQPQVEDKANESVNEATSEEGNSELSSTSELDIEDSVGSDAPPPQSTPNPNVPVRDAPPLPPDPVAALKKNKPKLEDLKPRSTPIVVVKPITPFDPLPMRGSEGVTSDADHVSKKPSIAPIDPPRL